MVKEQLLDRLNFQKIHAYMVLVDWTYYFDRQTPSIERLREAAGELLDIVMKSNDANASCSSGGFQANKWTWENKIVYEILFVLEDVSSNELHLHDPISTQ